MKRTIIHLCLLHYHQVIVACSKQISTKEEVVKFIQEKGNDNVDLERLRAFRKIKW